MSVLFWPAIPSADAGADSEQEVAYSDDRDYNTLSWHPEFDRMEGLKAEWFSRNPQIRQTSPSEGGMGSLPVAGMHNLHSSV